MIQALVKIFKEEGIPGLWRGTTSNILRIAAASAGQILTFEKAHGKYRIASFGYGYELRTILSDLNRILEGRISWFNLETIMFG